MNIAVATDFAGAQGDPRPRLREIAKAGFTHLHWCHQWCTDFMYAKAEVSAIKACLRSTGLKLLDIHGSQGCEKCWNSTVEYQRKAGVELVANRMRMLRELGGTGSVMMHVPVIHYGSAKRDVPGIMRQFDAVCKSIEELVPLARELQTPLALENMWEDNFVLLRRLMRMFPADAVGICYDSGHGNGGSCRGLDNLGKCKDRLMALHLHDNDGTGDQHQPPFCGNVDWRRVMRIIGESGYSREISFELSYRDKERHKTNLDFLKDAHVRCVRAINMGRRG